MDQTVLTMYSSKNIGAEPQTPHIVLLPSGMGQLTHFFRLAVMLAQHKCAITFIIIKPSATENSYISSFFSAHPEINFLDFEILPFDAIDSATFDPFIVKFKTINRSLHLISPLLSSLPQPISAIFSDFFLANGLAQITSDLRIPHYVVSTTSALFYSTIAYLPTLMSEMPGKLSSFSEELEIPGLAPLPRSSIPPPWLDKSPSNHLLTAYLLPNAQSLPKVEGVLLNTFDFFERETISALNNGRVLSNLPPVFPVGPFKPYKLKENTEFQWLNDQPPQSVVYVNFGQEPMSIDQMKELAYGLEMSDYTFLWVVRASKVNKDDSEELREMFGDSLLERTEKKGRIIRGWVNQEEILAHPAIGGFFNHCEWNSVMEAAMYGVSVLAWPQHGDQKMNAEVVEKAGLGMWARTWGWGGERLVKGEEIAKMVSQMMGDLNLIRAAKKVGEETKKALEVGGSSDKVLAGVVEMMKQRDGH